MAIPETRIEIHFGDKKSEKDAQSSRKMSMKGMPCTSSQICYDSERTHAALLTQPHLRMKTVSVWLLFIKKVTNVVPVWDTLMVHCLVEWCYVHNGSLASDKQARTTLTWHTLPRDLTQGEAMLLGISAALQVAVGNRWGCVVLLHLSMCQVEDARFIDESWLLSYPTSGIWANHYYHWL